MPMPAPDAAPRLAQLPPVEEAPAPLAAPPAAAEAPAPAGAGALPAAQQRWQLRYLTAQQLHARIEQVFGRPAPLLPDDGGPWLRFTVDAADGAAVLFAVNAQTSEVQLVGRPEQLAAWSQIIAALDSAPAPDRTTEVVAAEQAAAPQIRQTAQMLLAQMQIPGGGIGGLPLGESGELLGPVEIVNVEGTDLFVIRGNPEDVARVMEVIRQIEEMARVSEPRIVVRVLEHVDSQAIAVLLQQLFAPPTVDGQYTLGSFYGRLLALPLGRPNAVLLVAAPTTVDKAEEILQQLDVPTEAATQFEVFQLKFAGAEQAQTVVAQLFAAQAATQTVPATFGPKALVIAELRTNALIVRASPADMAEVRELAAKLDSPGAETVNEIRVFRLRHSLALTLAPVLQRAVRGEGTGTTAADRQEGLATLLRMVTIDATGQQQLASGVLAGVTVNADTRANALVVSAPPDSMPLMAALIAQLDQPPDAVAELKVFTITNGDAVSLAEMLQELFGAPQQQGGGGQQAAANVFQLRFSVDERTNSIIAAGSGDELLVVEAVLRRLDDGESRSRINRVYRLKNASAEGVALALQDWLQRKREVEQTAPGVVSPFAQIEREVVVVAEIASNSLIVSATPTYYQELEQLIEQLDEQAPMVMIQVLIGEVRLGDADEFGVELGLQDPLLFNRSLLSNIETTSTTTTIGNQTTIQQDIVQSADLTPGFNFGNPGLGLPNSGSDRSLATAGAVAAQGLSSFAVNRVSPDLGFGGFVLSASSNSVSMLLRALQESRRLEVLSRPQIMALDNQPGRSFVGQIVPIITATTLNQFGSPNKTTDDLVVMTVSAIKRELGSTDQGIPIAFAANGDPIRSPIINSTEAQTTVSAVGGQTVVLSGLLTKRDEALHRRVPLLADIPLVGALFRFDSSRQVRTELLIVLTPHVIRSRAEAERLKQIESARMSWCLADVVDLHGPAGLRSRTDMLGAAESQLVYPNLPAEELQRISPLPEGQWLPEPADAGNYSYPPPAPILAP
ncbi:MAG TPA: secretin N-terminal domain-containing protein, partial [Lacipirellulaceae bacterium]|nr:secretin N-terminal domain-containing protein [Lacipirellulaceae bacterium]